MMASGRPRRKSRAAPSVSWLREFLHATSGLHPNSFRWVLADAPRRGGGAMRKVELSGLTGIRFYAALPVYLAHVTVIPGMEALSGGGAFFHFGGGGGAPLFPPCGVSLAYHYAAGFVAAVSGGHHAAFGRG